MIGIKSAIPLGAVRVWDGTSASPGGLCWRDRLVAIAVEVVGLDVDLGHFGVGDLDRLRIIVLVEAAMDGEAGAGRGRPDQLDDHRMGKQRFATPVLCNEGEEAMFDAVPFAGAGRVVGERDRQPD